METNIIRTSSMQTWIPTFDAALQNSPIYSPGEY